MDALEMSLRALGLQPGQKVLTTPLSAFATTLAVIRAGGVPVFCDVDENGLLDLDQADACLRQMPDIKFLMPVHLYGHALDLARLRDLMARYNVIVIEDAAQAIGAGRDGQVHWKLRARDLLQLLSDQEPRNAGGWRRHHHQRRRGLQGIDHAAQLRPERALHSHAPGFEQPPRRAPCSALAPGVSAAVARVDKAST